MCSGDRYHRLNKKHETKHTYMCSKQTAAATACA